MAFSIPEETLRTIQTRALAVLIGFAFGSILILLTGNDPLIAYVSLFNGILGSVYSITETLVKTIPLLLAGLGMAIAFRCKVINIGGEGQIYTIGRSKSSAVYYGPVIKSDAYVGMNQNHRPDGLESIHDYRENYPDEK